MAKTKEKKTLPFKNIDIQLSRFTKALGHPARVAILRILIIHNNCTCNEIVEKLPLAQSTVSQHLKELRNSGIVVAVDAPPKVYYKPNQELLLLIALVWRLTVNQPQQNNNIIGAIVENDITDFFEVIKSNAMHASMLMRINKIKKNIDMENKHLQAVNPYENIEELIKNMQAESIYRIDYNYDGVIVKASGAVLDLFCITKDDIIGKNYKNIIVRPEGFELETDFFWKDIQKGFPKKQINTIKIKNKQIVLYEIYKPIIGENDKVVRVINLGYNLSGKCVNL